MLSLHNFLGMPVLVALLPAILLLTSTTALPSSIPSDPTYWFSFGDSYTATKFNINGTQPSVGNPLGNPPYPGDTQAGGPTWIDVTTTVSNHSTILTYNLAVSGAVVDKALTPSTVTSVTEQVQSFATWNSGTNQTSWTGSNSLFSFWIGINDIGVSVWELQPSDPSAFNGDILYRYFNQAQTLYDLGARNFLFINVPPMERSPKFLAQPDNQSAEHSQILDYNLRLASATPAFQANHTGVNAWFWDSHTYFNTILDSPATYGFQDSTSYGKGDQYFWGDIYHPSGAAQTLFGIEIGNLLAGTLF